MRHGHAAPAGLIALAIAVTAALSLHVTPARAQSGDEFSIEAGGATQRPLSDFLSAQGSTNVFIPPLPDFIGWANNDPQTLFASVDYLGLVAGYLATHGGPVLGTQVDGTVLERRLPDGRAEVTVTTQSTNALTWVLPIPFNDLANDPLVFGYRGTDLLANPTLPPALSSAEAKVVFTNTAPGAPLPDLITFILGTNLPGQELLSLNFRSNGTGLLRAASGFPEGTPGRCSITQTGLFFTGFHGAVGDGFPAERVTIRPIGEGSLAPHPVAITSRTPNGGAGTSGTSGTARSTWGSIKSLYR